MILSSSKTSDAPDFRLAGENGFGGVKNGQRRMDSAILTGMADSVPQHCANRRKLNRWLIALLGVEGFLFLSEQFQWFPFNRHMGWTALIAVASVSVPILFLMLRWLAGLRWFRLTPDRCLIALLVVEVLLLLSEQFSWFGFNEHKGWPVLIAIASVVIVLFAMLLWFAVGVVFRWKFQFSIRSLLALAVLVAIPCSWLAVERKQANKQRHIVADIKSAGGAVQYDWEVVWNGILVSHEQALGPAWLVDLLGSDFFGVPVGAYLDNTAATEATLEHVAGLTHLQVLLLSNTQVTDRGLKTLQGLRHLRKLDLDNTQVSDDGLEHLRDLTHIEELHLKNTQVTDTGLGHLAGLTHLQWLVLDATEVTGTGLGHLSGLTNFQILSLRNTKVTDAGLAEIEGATALQSLNLYNTPVTGTGLGHLEGLARLQYLNLDRTKVSDTGMEHLEGLTELQSLLLNNTHITDVGLAHLAKLTQLKELFLDDTRITDAGLQHLKGMTQLVSLWLHNTRVTDAGLATLEGLPQLRGLCLKGTGVTVAGVKKLQQALPMCGVEY